MNIIDFRYRPSTVETISGIANNPVYFEFCKRLPFLNQPQVTFEEAMEELAGLHVVKAVVTGRDIESTYGAIPSNDEVLSYVQKQPDRLIGFYGFDPHKGMQAILSLRNALKEGFSGASIDPGMARLPISDARFYPLYAICCEFDVPVAITTGLSPFMPKVVLEHGAPCHIDRVAADFPELRMVISHACYPRVLEALAVSQRNPNVYLDFSTIEHLPGAECLVQAASTTHAEKIVFSSANPFNSLKKAIDYYCHLNLDSNILDNIMFNNAAHILKLY